jgi:hypothetical protein
MDSGQRQYLEQRHAVRQWHGQGAANPRMITDFAFTGSELSGWTLLRASREERHTPPAFHSLWHRGDPTVELLSIDFWVCVSVAAAHDQLIEALANIQSDAVERHHGLGDIAFVLSDRMALFARVNVVVLIRNAGPKTVEVDHVSRLIDGLLVRLSDGGRPGPRSPRQRR